MSGEVLKWKLLRFSEMVERWIEREAPDDETRLAVLEWIIGRVDDPYRGMRREEGFPNLWFGPVRETQNEGTVVTCSYWINERLRMVQCNDICTLNQPI